MGMSSSRPTALRAFDNPVFQRLVAVWLVVIVLAYRVIEVALAPRPWARDFSAYWLAGVHLLNGQPIYTAAQLGASYAPQAQYLYLYPPPLAALLTPLAAVWPNDVYPPYFVWTAIGLAFAGAVVLAIARREGLTRRFQLLAGPGVVLLLAGAIVMPPVIGEIENGNVHFLLLGLFGLAWLGLRRGGRLGEAVAGGSIGIAAVIKIFPGLLLLWLVLTWRWRAAGWVLVGAAALCLATLPITGLQPWLDFPTALMNMGGPIDATFSFAPTTFLSDWLGFGIARLLVTALGLAAVAWAALRCDLRSGFAACVLVSLLVTPILWSHYVTIAVLPMLLGLATGLPLALLGLVYLLLSTANQPAFGEAGFLISRVAPLLGMLLLLAALLVQRRAVAVVDGVDVAGTVSSPA